MEKTTLSITFGKEQISTQEDILSIEVGEWNVSNNQLEYDDLYTFLNTRLVNVSDVGNPFDLVYINEPSIECGLNYTMEIPVYVYRADKDMPYTLFCTHGTLSDVSDEEISIEESLEFGIEDSLSMEYYPEGSVTWEWVGTVYDEDGNEIDPPDVIIDGKDVNVGFSVYGVLKVSYSLTRDNYTLSITLEDVKDDTIGGVLYAKYSGGVTWLEVDKPESTLGDGECGYSWGNVTFSFPDPEDGFEAPTEAPKVNTTKTRDYCSGDLINVEEEYV